MDIKNTLAGLVLPIMILTGSVGLIGRNVKEYLSFPANIEVNEEMTTRARLDNYFYFKNYLTYDKAIDQEEKSFGDSFYSIILSNIAEGLTKYAEKNPDKKGEVGDLLKKTLERSVELGIPLYPNGIEFEDLRDDGVYLAHLNIVLNEYLKFNKDAEAEKLNSRISKHLSKSTIQDPFNHVRSFRYSELRFPADQSTSLYSIWEYDQMNGTNYSKKAIEKWIDFMNKRGRDKRTGLHISEVSGQDPKGKIPRGCALSWEIAYMSKFAPEEAKKMWELYKEHFYEGNIVSGFREYPRGIRLISDPDSGQILFGRGEAATAFGIRAAREINDGTVLSELEKTESRARNLLGLIIDKDKPNTITNNLLARSITFNNEN